MINKKICAIIISICLAFSCVSAPVSAFGADWTAIIYGTFAGVSVPEVVAVVLMILGVSVGSAVLTDNADTLTSLWDDYLDTLTDAKDIAENWMEDAKNGIIDTASDVWTSFISYLTTSESVTSNFVGDRALVLTSGEISTSSTGFSLGVTTTTYTSQKVYFAYCYSTGKLYGYMSASPDEYGAYCQYNDGFYVGFTISYSADYDLYSGGIVGTSMASKFPEVSENAYFESYDEFYDFVLNQAPYMYDYCNDTVWDLVTDLPTSVDWLTITDSGVLTGAKDISVENLVETYGSVADVLTAVNSGSLTWSDVISATDTVAVANVLDDDLSVADSYVITDSGVSDVSITDYVTDISDLEDYTLSLTDFFPFCIPFDLYNLLCVLTADPVAPSFDFLIPNPAGDDFIVTIDLSVFDSVAQILRQIECLAFCVGLVMITRQQLLGGD